MSQTHIKTMQGWLSDVRKEATISQGLKVFFTQLGNIEDPDERLQIIRAIAKGEYGNLSQALTENTPYSAAASGAGK